ncbi:MAG TPA: DMT family transporter [Candidatus Thermoplasmatota archaeon]|nr:DMT family transporter [Candidatus Thermoplasmatota archaeon]
MQRGRLAGGNLVLLLTLGAMWGVAFAFISIGLESFSPVLFAAYRFDVAGACVLAIALWRASRSGKGWASLRPATGAQWTAIGVAAALNVGAYHALLFWGQAFTTPAIAAVIVGLNPILTTVFSRALLEDERVGAAGALGLALGLGGILILATFKEGSLLDARGIGELACLGAIASWSVGSILVRRTRHGMDVFAFTAWQMLAGAALLHLSALAIEPGRFAVWDAPGVASLLYLAVVSSAVGFLIYFTLLERLGPIRTNMVSHVAPVFAATAGFAAQAGGLLDAAAFEWRALAAFALIAAGFGLVAREPRAG